MICLFSPPFSGEVRADEGAGSLQDEQTIRRIVLEWISLADRFGDHVDPIIFGASAIGPVVEVLREPDRHTAYALSNAIGTYGRLIEKFPKTQPRFELRRFLTHGDAGVRSMTLVALGKIGTREDIPSLVAELHDPELVARTDAITSLGRIGDASALSALRIWHKLTQESDKNRASSEKWLTSDVSRHYDAAVAYIEARISAKPMK